MHRRHDERRCFCRFSHSAGRVAGLIAILPFFPRCRTLVDRRLKLLDKTLGKVLVLVPKLDQAVDLSGMLRAVVERRSASDQGGERRLEFLSKGLVTVAVLDVVENVVQDVQDM